MAEPLYRVELTVSFLERLDAIEMFPAEAGAAFAFDRLLDALRATVISNLRRFPRIGRRYLAHPPQSAESLAQLAALPPAAPDALREYLHGDYLMLYTVVDAAPKASATVYLLSTASSPTVVRLRQALARGLMGARDACHRASRPTCARRACWLTGCWPPGAEPLATST